MIEAARKAAKQLEKSAAALASALPMLERPDLDGRPFAVQTACADALDALRSMRELTPAIVEVEAVLRPIEAAARDAADRRRALFAGELSDALAGFGLRLTGRLPALECGPLSLELAGTSRPEIRVWYGPKIELLDSLDVDAAAVAKAVQKRIEELDGTPLDQRTFISELFAAWRIAQNRAGLGPTEKAQITDVLGEMAFGRQSAAFRANPTGKGFTGYGRLAFSHDLGRLTQRRFERGELALTVATRDQTKRPTDHLWVAGTHFSQLGFRETA